MIGLTEEESAAFFDVKKTTSEQTSLLFLPLPEAVQYDQQSWSWWTPRGGFLYLSIPFLEKM